ncbi:hypothetical protein ACJIZ3_010467 [Penstemon smallii]|uniref:Exocyst subunit Exo70 family protein n=1 Tax=Penstemon smallii TaxID=265156 RepID=A0ABD3TFF8_9LAMI
MEKNILDNYKSFGKNAPIPSSPRTPHSVTFSDDTLDQHPKHHNQYIIENLDDDDISSQAQVSEDIDQFTNDLSQIHDKSLGPTQIPDSIETLSKIIESRIAKYSSGDNNKVFGKMTEEDSFFLEAVKRISKLANALSDFSSNTNTNPSLNRTSVVLQHAMAFLEEEFRSLLEDSVENLQQFCKFLSFNSKNQKEYSDRVIQRELDPGETDDYSAYSPEVVIKMNRIASTMISAGYDTECCQVYSLSRRIAIRNQMKKLEFEKLNIDDAVKMPWESLETEIWRWIKVVKNCAEIIFPGEKKLVELVFSDHPVICNSLFSNLARAVVILLLDFAEATAMAKRSAEKLFKFLDMYEALQSLGKAIGSGESCSDEIAATANRIGESAASNFCELENSIKSDSARTPVHGGAVHPLTRYVMNYLEYSCEYKDTLEKIFEKHTGGAEKQTIPPMSNTPPLLSPNTAEKESESPHNFDTIASTTPFSVQVITVMDLLDSNLETKSSLYRDPALRYVFLMNNGRYILQKVKGSNEIRQVMGDNWCRRRSTVVRQYHKNYQRETWYKLIQCLNQEGLQVNGKVNKSLLKERFKVFTTTFDEIHRMQSAWVVSDDQLKSEIRISISAVVIPAYRSFLGRFKQYLDSGKQAEKYIKYQPEDIETLIDDLFEGNTTSMARRRT